MEIPPALSLRQISPKLLKLHSCEAYPAARVFAFGALRSELQFSGTKFFARLERTFYLQIRTQLPYLRKQHHIEHFAQVAHAACAAGAAFEADDAFDRGDVAKAPESECVFEIGEFFAELVEIKILFRVAVDDQPGLTRCLPCLSPSTKPLTTAAI